MSTIFVTGSLSKLFLKCTTRCHVQNLDVLLDAVRSKTGVLTYSNHISTLDDPLFYGLVPWSLYTRPSDFRWTLGAKDVCFTNPLFSAFFKAGQVLPTDRHGPGIYQPAVDTAIQLLRAGKWVHIFPEAYVNTQIYPFRRFKWGISRILTEVQQGCQVLPIYIKGFNDIMPEGRKAPFKFIPRVGQSVSMVVNPKPLDRRRLINHLVDPTSIDSSKIGPRPFYEGEPSGFKQKRIAIADVLRNALIELKETCDP